MTGQCREAAVHKPENGELVWWWCGISRAAPRSALRRASTALAATDWNPNPAKPHAGALAKYARSKTHLIICYTQTNKSRI